MKGYYFKSEHDVTTYFFIDFLIVENESNCIVRIWEIDQRATNICSDSKDKQSGDEIDLEDFQVDLIASVDLWGKYFFPEYAENYKPQYYYDDMTYYGADYKSDTIIAVAEAINFAIKLGLEKANIKPY